jgi:hypothetical protein
MKEEEKQAGGKERKNIFQMRKERMIRKKQEGVKDRKKKAKCKERKEKHLREGTGNQAKKKVSIK